MGSLNKCSFIGNAARDAEVRSTANGMPVANVSIACNYKAGGEEMVEWVSLVFFDKLADVAGDYITKGKQVYVDGRMQTRKWDDKDGVTHYTTEIVVSNLVLLGGGEGGEGGGERGGGGGRGDDRGGRQAPSRGRGDDRGDRGGRDARTHGEQRSQRTAGYRDEAPPPRRQQQSRDDAPPPRRQAPPKSNTGFDNMDDDIPF